METFRWHGRRVNRCLGAASRIAAAILCAAFAGTNAWANDKLQIGITSTASDIAIYIAEKRGLFAAEGIDAELVPFPSATQMIAPLSSGELDVGAGAPGAGLYNAGGRNIAVKIVADKGSMPKGHGYLSLVVRKDLVEEGKVKTLADLKGRRIGDLSKQGSGDVTLNEALKKGGLRFTDVETAYMGGPQLAIALENKVLDGALITEPSMSIAIARGAAVLFARSDEIYPNQQLAVVLFSEKLITSKRTLAERFMRAYVRGARVYNDALRNGHLTGPGADDVIDLLIARTNFKDRPLYRSMISPGLNPDCHVNISGLRNDFAFYRSMGWIDKPLDPDALVDDSFCEHAVAALGPYAK